MSKPLSSVLGSIATYVYGRYIDEVLQMQRCGTGILPVDCTTGVPPVDYYYHTDDLYNVMAVTDGAGNVVERYEYDDYGTPMVMAPDGTVFASSTIGNPYLFTGRRYDAETSWYHYRTRYLDPAAGRFTTRDTIGIWGDPYELGNGYSLVGNSPLSWLDPYGLNIYFVYVGVTFPNPFGHAALKHVDKDGKITYYDISKDADDKKIKARKYTEREFKEKYGNREPEEVCVEVPNEDATKAYCEGWTRADREDWDYDTRRNNCVTFVQTAIKVGGGKTESDGSKGEKPERFPRDARDGHKKAALQLAAEEAAYRKRIENLRALGPIGSGDHDGQ
jgi:RHS repeat-associated protein